MSSLGHEGNPKEASIAVTGLLSTASLDIIAQSSQDRRKADVEKSCGCTGLAGDPFRLVSCTAGNSIGCGANKLNYLHLQACGGTPPYTWSATGDITATQITNAWTQVTLLNAITVGATPTGAAYIKPLRQLTGSGCSSAAYIYSLYSCSDVELAPTDCSGSFWLVPYGNAGDIVCRDVSCSDSTLPVCTTTDWCDTTKTAGSVDIRDAGLISGGCYPCGVAVAGATVTLTDAKGLVTTLIVRV